MRLHQQSFHSGAQILALRQARKGRYTQAEIAARAGLSLPTVRLLGLVVTDVPKVPIWKAFSINGLRHGVRGNLLIS